MLNDYSSIAGRPNVVLLDSVDSTNNYIRKLIASAVPGVRTLAVIADRQTGGRGRYGRSFYSPEDTGIYMSFAFRAEPDDPGIGHITAYTAAILHRILSPFSASPLKIKWVNDLYNDSGKTTGVLTELIPPGEAPSASCALPDEGGATGRSSAGAACWWVVVGAGVNLRAPLNEDPSLAGVMGHITENDATSGPSRGEVASSMLDAFEKLWSGGAVICPELHSYYRDSCMSLGRTLEVRPPGQAPYMARILSLDDDFALNVERCSDGVRLRISSGEVSLSR